MNKKLFLLGAVLSIAAISASCGGKKSSGSNSNPPPGSTPPPSGGNQTSNLQAPAVFVGILEDNKATYYVVDKAGAKAKVKNLDNVTITDILYQFNNRNLIVKDQSNKLYCINVQDLNNPKAVDLNLVDGSSAYSLGELVENRPYFIVNTATDSYVVKNDCSNPVLVTNSKLMVKIATNNYAIVEDMTNKAIVVLSDGSKQVLDTNYAANILVDGGGDINPAKDMFILTNGTANKAYFVNDAGKVYELTAFPAGLNSRAIRVQQSGNNYVVAALDNPNNAINVYQITGTATSIAPAIINDTNNCTAGGTIAQIQAFDLDVDGYVYIGFGAGGPAGAQCFGNNVTAGHIHIGLTDASGVDKGSFNTGSPANITLMAGANKGVLVFNSANNVYYARRDNTNNLHSSSNINLNTNTCNGAINNLGNLAGAYNNAPIRGIKRDRTNMVYMGMLNLAGSNFVAQVDVLNNTTPCQVSIAPSTGDVFSANLNEAYSNAFVIRRGIGQTLIHQTPSSVIIKTNVTENNFNPLDCGSVSDAIVQLYSSTQRVCSSGSNVYAIDYDNDRRTSISSPLLSAIFGDISNKTFASNPVFLASSTNTACISLGLPQKLYISNNSPVDLSNTKSCFIVPQSPNNAFRVPLVAE